MPTTALTAHTRPWPTSTPPALLIAVVDLHPLAWSLLSNLHPSPSSPTLGEKEKAPISPLTLEEFVTNLMVFLNAHLASRWGNEVVVYGATAAKAQVYNRPSQLTSGFFCIHYQTKWRRRSRSPTSTGRSRCWTRVSRSRSRLLYERRRSGWTRARGRG